MVRLLKIFRPIGRIVPEVAMPKRRVALTEKILWTLFALAAFLIMAEIRLYGVAPGYDPFRAYRVIFASNRGTLMELGIMPIVNAGLILQVLAGSGLVGIDLSEPEDKALFSVAMKALALILTAVTASSYILMGYYGTLTPTASVVAFAELVTAGLVIILLDEMLQKGWGLGSGISLFILAGVCREIWWSCFGFDPWSGYVGAVIAFFQSLIGGGNVWDSVYRRNLPDMIGLLSTAAVFLAIIYLDNIRTEFPVSHARFRGVRGRYPIKLLYVSVIPVIFASMLFYNYILVTQLIWSRITPHEGIWWDILGRFEDGGGGMPQPISGLAYYLMSPRSLEGVVADPVRAIAYAGLLILACALFAYLWVQIGGVGPADVARQLIDSGMFIPGFRRSYGIAERVLRRYIPTIALISGITVGAIAAFSDFLGVFGSGTGVLLAVGIVYQYYQSLVRERALEMYPALAAIMGR